MKRNLFLLCLLFAAPSITYAQQNFSFPESDAEWITTRVSGCIGGSSIYNLWREYLGPDTLLQGHTYQKLFLQPECTLVTQGLHCDYSLTPYQGEAFVVGGLRVDGQRVYFQKFDLSQNALLNYENDLLDLPSGVDVLLYDFDRVVGDTLVAPLAGGAAKLYKVSTITLLPSGRKKFKLTHINGFGYTQEMVEGAGNTRGLFGNYSDPSGSSYLPLDGMVVSTKMANRCWNLPIVIFVAAWMFVQIFRNDPLYCFPTPPTTKSAFRPAPAMQSIAM